MAIQVATNLRRGQVIKVDGALYRVHKVTHNNSAQRRGNIVTLCRSVPQGVLHDMRFRPEDKIEIVHIERQKMTYMYNDSNHYTFMNQESYEQISLDKEVLGDDVGYLTDDLEVEVDFHESTPIGIELPSTVPMEIVETQPGMRSATASASKKPAKTNTGITVAVPQFVETGDRVTVNTADGTYVDRVK